MDRSKNINEWLIIEQRKNGQGVDEWVRAGESSTRLVNQNKESQQRLTEQHIHIVG